MSIEGSKPRVLSLFDEEPVEVGVDPLRWVPVRRSLGIGAFGVNAYRAGAGEAVIEDHVESPGQEELYVVLRGRVDFLVGDERVQLAVGQAVFVADPEVRRGATALVADTAVLAIGGWREQPYHSLPWEPIYLSDGAFRRGEWAESAEILEREAGEHRGSPFIRYRLACCLAQLGEDEAALAELRAAVEAKPQMQERAAADELLEPLRELDGWSPGG
ncbi:MAG: hypothetical protein ABI726_09360 [bacterium]